MTADGVLIERASDLPAAIRSLEVPKKLFVETIGDHAQHQICKAMSSFQDQTFELPIIDRLQVSGSGGPAPYRFYHDMLIRTVVLKLSQCSGVRSAIDPDRDQILPLKALDDITLYIDNCGSSMVDVETLARLAGMPVSAFHAALKKSTGRTPYQHVLGGRIANARRVLEQTALSLSEFAYRNGFSSRRHMTDLLRTRLKVTPGAIRSDFGRSAEAD